MFDYSVYGRASLERRDHQQPVENSTINRILSRVPIIMRGDLVFILDTYSSYK